VKTKNGKERNIFVIWGGKGRRSVVTWRGKKKQLISGQQLGGEKRDQTAEKRVIRKETPNVGFLPARVRPVGRGSNL